jgi:hypothetical protein
MQNIFKHKAMDFQKTKLFVTYNMNFDLQLY